MTKYLTMSVGRGINSYRPWPKMLPRYVRFHQFAKKDMSRIKHHSHIDSYGLDRSGF